MKHKMMSKVKKHLKDDMKMFKKEKDEDKALLKKMAEKKSYKKKPMDKMEKVMHEFKEARLRSGSKKGPVVKNRKQAIAIGLSEMRRNKK